MSAQEEERAVAEFIRAKGVTRCPTVCAAATQAAVACSDPGELQRYAAAQEAARLARRPKYGKARSEPARAQEPAAQDAHVKK